MATNKFEGKKSEKNLYLFGRIIKLANAGNATRSVLLLIWQFFFGDQIILYGDHFTAEGRQRVTFWKGTWSPEVNLLINGNYTFGAFFFEFRK